MYGPTIVLSCDIKDGMQRVNMWSANQIYGVATAKSPQFELSEAIRFVCAKIAASGNNNKKNRATTIDQETECRWMVPVAHHP